MPSRSIYGKIIGKTYKRLNTSWRKIEKMVKGNNGLLKSNWKTER